LKHHANPFSGAMRTDGRTEDAANGRYSQILRKRLEISVPNFGYCAVEFPNTKKVTKIFVNSKNTPIFEDEKKKLHNTEKSFLKRRIQRRSHFR